MVAGSVVNGSALRVMSLETWQPSHDTTDHDYTSKPAYNHHFCWYRQLEPVMRRLSMAVEYLFVGYRKETRYGGVSDR